MATALEAPRTVAPPEEFQPYVPAARVLPELTFKAIALGVVLAVLLGAANMYVGLRVGLTVSASIPAAVLSMGILRLFRKANILENNIVQTFAASGEAVAAGLIFTIPALLILTDPSVPGAETPLWEAVQVGPTLLIGLAGGILGVLFCIPLRRAYIVDAKLPFPEGVACAEVLKAGERGGAGVKVLVGGLLVGSIYSFLQGGMRLWTDAVEGARRIGGSGVAYFGTNVAPILLGVGYIVGLRISLLITLGGAIAWFVLIPLFLTTGIPGVTAATPYAGMDPLTAANTVWTTKIRLVGGGAMITGGLFTLWKTRKSLAAAFAQGRRVGAGGAGADAERRTDRDIPLRVIAIGSAALSLPIFALFYVFTANLVHAAVAGVLMAIAGFFFSAVAGYMAGVVGSSNNPISGVTIVTLITSSLLLLALGAQGAPGILAALGIGAVICVAGAMAGDTLQDLKAGYLVGSTPWKQQLAQILGVVAFGLTAPFILQALIEAYGIGPGGLQAPQAFLMSRILTGIFGGTLDWNLILLGAAIGVALILLRLPVMPVAVGIYLPFLLSVPIAIGGAINWAVTRHAQRRPAPSEAARTERMSRLEQTGLLFASGLIAGEAIMGILIAGIILNEPVSGARVLTAQLAPLLLGLLAAGGAVVFLRGAKRHALAAALALAGGAWSYLRFAADAGYSFAASTEWPALLVFAYVTFLVAYVPLREVLREGRAAS